MDPKIVWRFIFPWRLVLQNMCWLDMTIFGLFYCHPTHALPNRGLSPTEDLNSIIFVYKRLIYPIIIDPISTLRLKNWWVFSKTTFTIRFAKSHLSWSTLFFHSLVRKQVCREKDNLRTGKHRPCSSYHRQTLGPTRRIRLDLSPSHPLQLLSQPTHMSSSCMLAFSPQTAFLHL